MSDSSWSNASSYSWVDPSQYANYAAPPPPPPSEPNPPPPPPPTEKDSASAASTTTNAYPQPYPPGPYANPYASYYHYYQQQAYAAGYAQQQKYQAYQGTNSYPNSQEDPSKKRSYEPESRSNGNHDTSKRRRFSDTPPSVPMPPAAALSLTANGTSADKERKPEQDITVKGCDVKKIQTFEELHLPDFITRALQKNKWVSPTPIQSVAIPIAVSGRDLIGIAQTGSGKSLAFALPGVLHYLKQHKSHSSRGPYILILTPTRELAIQLHETVAALCYYGAHIRSALAYGGVSKSSQSGQLYRGVEILIATPGRLIDFMESRVTSLHEVSYLVLDEADRMLDMGFEPQIRKIIDKIPTKRQTLMFSATWPVEVQKLARDFLNDPVQIAVGQVSNKASANTDITQVVQVCSKFQKMEKLLAVLPSLVQSGSGVIFALLKKSTDWLERELIKYGFPAIGIHGDKPQYAREKNLSLFNNGTRPILVATDVASRGLDFKDVKWVVNFEFPQTCEDYVHRIGRTGRAGSKGYAYSLITEEEGRLARPLVDVLRSAGQAVDPSLLELASRPPPPNSKSRNRYSRPGGPMGGPPRYGGSGSFGSKGGMSGPPRYDGDSHSKGSHSSSSYHAPPSNYSYGSSSSGAASTSSSSSRRDGYRH